MKHITYIVAFAFSLLAVPARAEISSSYNTHSASAIQPYSGTFSFSAFSPVYIEGEGFTSSYGQSRKCVTEEEYFSLTEIYAEAITTNESPELTKFHGELGDEDKNLNVLLMEKQKNVFVVMLKQNEYTKSGATIELYNMILPNDISLFVYSAMYDSPLILYNSPSTRSMKEQCDTYVADPLLIIDVYNTWLKVQFEESGKKFEGWIPKEEYCANPYTTCN